MYSLDNKKLSYTALERSKVISSILLPSSLLETVSSEFTTCSGTDLLLNVKEGKLDSFLISWLDFPEKCFNSLECTVILRKDKMKQLPNYALILVKK
jgi:hypothetical protein